MDTISEHEIIRDAVRRFAETVVAPASAALWEKQEFPLEIWRQAAKLGFPGLPYPVEYGGGGGDWVSFAIVLEELARVDCAVANAVMANSTVSSLLHYYGTEAQKQQYLVPMLRGTHIGAIGLTEPNAGSDAANIATRADWDGKQWVVNGAKTFISNTGTGITHPVVIAAVTGMRSNGRKEISNFIVPGDAPGFHLGRKLQKIGWRASSTYELFFQDCRLPADNLLGERGAGLRQTLSQISMGRVMIGALALGLLQGSLDRSLAYMKERRAFGQPLAAFQALQFKVADMAVHTHAARLMIYDAAARRDRGESFAREASMAKLFATEKAMEATHQTIQIHGGYGIITEYPAARAMGDAKVLEIVEGTSEIQRLIISRELLA